LALSLPLLCPINVNFRPVVVPWQRDGTEAGIRAVAAAAAFDSVPALAHPEPWSVAHPALALATWLPGRLPAHAPRRAY
jgi:hypothetical protein